MFSVNYLIKSSKNEIRKKTFEICVEQTIEFPYHLVKSKYIKNNIVGKIVSIKKVEKNLFRAKISYDEIITGNEFTQFLNVLFGNTSIKPNIKIEKIIPSKSIIRNFKGPVFGIQGIRKTLKPLGYLTRDARKKERKKPGLKRARRAPQWQKR